MLIEPFPEWWHQEWRHSHEEDTGEDMVFRPASFGFQPSRGRRSLEFRRDGTVRGSRPGPSDRRETSTGRWEIEDDILRLFAAWGTAPSELLQILSAAPQRLVLRRI